VFLDLELMILVLTIGVMYVAELVNTAFEEVVNLITQETITPWRESVRVSRPESVLVAALTALCIGYFVFRDYFTTLKVDQIYEQRKELMEVASRGQRSKLMFLILTTR
jgi:hypothetical protein